MSKKSFTVYMHVAPNGKKYVGITSQTPSRRWHCGHGYKGNKYLYRAIVKYGWDSFKHLILADGLTQSEACELERAYIKKYDTTDRKKGYNHSTGGECHVLGYKMPDDVKQKHRLSQLGRTATPETRRKFSEQRKGRPSWNKGKKLSQRHLEKLCEPIICVETRVTYFGITEAARQLGICRPNICKCLSGEREKAGGYHWQKVNKA